MDSQKVYKISERLEAGPKAKTGGRREVETSATPSSGSRGVSRPPKP